MLLAFGLVHLLLIWNGDILTEYALAGVLALPLLLLAGRWLLIAALGLLVVYAIGPVLLYTIPWPDDAALGAHVASANQVYSAGNLADVRRFSFAELPLILRLHAYAFPRTLALFLFGVLLWRTGILQRAAGFKLNTAIAASAGIAAGMVLTAATPLGSIAGFLCARAARVRLWRRAASHCSIARDAPRRVVTGTGRTYGVHQLRAAIDHLRLRLFRLRPRPIRSHGRRSRPGSWCGSFRGADRPEQMVVATPSLRPARMAVAKPDVHNAAAHAQPCAAVLGRRIISLSAPGRAAARRPSC